MTATTLCLKRLHMAVLLMLNDSTCDDKHVRSAICICYRWDMNGNEATNCATERTPSCFFKLHQPGVTLLEKLARCRDVAAT